MKFRSDNAENSLRLSQQAAYTAPIMMLAFLFGPLGVLQGIYAKYFGVALTTIATVLLISRFFDAISDPLVGYWSDRHHAKTGSRKPFIMAGGLLFIISSYFLYVPVDLNSLSSSTTVSATYFLVWFLLFYFGWTLLEIPHYAWGAELAGSARAKNKIFSFRTTATLMGMLLFYFVPLLPFFPNNEFTPQTLKWAVITAGALMLPALYYCIKLTPNGINTGANTKSKQDSLWALRREIVANKPFLLFIAAFCLFGIAGTGMWFTLVFIFIDSFLKLGNYFALLMIIALVLSLVCLGFWYWLANRLGKKLAWGLGTFLYALGAVYAGFLEPGKTSLVGLSVVVLLINIGSTPINALSPSLLADIIDYSRWKFGTDRSATYFSLYMLILKSAIAIGGSIGLGIAGWYGFDPSASEHTDKAVFGLRLAACWLPAMLLLLAVFIMSFVPINERRHHIIYRRLELQRQRQLLACKSSITDNIQTSTVSSLNTVSS